MFCVMFEMQATSALDSVSERLVQGALDRLMKVWITPSSCSLWCEAFVLLKLECKEYFNYEQAYTVSLFQVLIYIYTYTEELEGNSNGEQGPLELKVAGMSRAFGSTSSSPLTFLLCVCRAEQHW